MVRKYLVTENEFLSATVDAADGHLRFTRDNGQVVDAGKVSGDVTPEALAAATAAETAAQQAGAARDQAQQIALGNAYAALGAVFKVQATPPAAATENGLPVLWIDTTEQLVPTPALPPSPSWNDTLSRFTVPTGVIGVDYVWTSGGGGVGATLTPGATLSTTGTYPRTVTITPVAKPGYVLASGVRPFVHDFYDPNVLTVLTSDGFSGGASSSIIGRSLDLALGGSAASWSGDDLWQINASAQLEKKAGLAGIGRIVLAGGLIASNYRVEFDVVSISGEGQFGTAAGLVVGIRNQSGSPYQFELSIGGRGPAHRGCSVAASRRH